MTVGILAPVLRGNAFSFSPLSMMLTLIFLYIPFYLFIYLLPHYTVCRILVLRAGIETTPPAGESQFPNHLTIWGVHSLYYEKKVCCLYINFVESFCNKSNLEFCWILPNVLLEVWKWSYDFFLCCANLVCHLIDLHIWNHSCIAEINPIWSWCMILLMYRWIQFSNIWLRIFASEILACSVQSLSCVRLFVTLWTAAHQVSLSITNSRSSPKLMFIESVMPSNHLILCCPLLLLPSIFPSIRVFSIESALHIRNIGL